jgi:hypothetical protein
MPIHPPQKKNKKKEEKKREKLCTCPMNSTESLNFNFKNRGKIFMLLSFLITVGQVVLGGT